MNSIKVATRLVAVLAVALATVTVADASDIRPNVVLIVVDDMRKDEFGAGGHSYLETPNIDELVEQGAMFTNAYHATPLCSPNRASILTGQYSSRHGILDNTSRAHASHRLDLFAKELKHAGYKTAHIGKWHIGNDPTPRPGYDYWVSFEGQGEVHDPELYEEGRIHRVEGYITDIFTDRAVDFISDSQNSSQPFFMYIGHKTIHPQAVQFDDGTVDLSIPMEFVPAKRHMGRYEEEVFDRRPSVKSVEAMLEGISDKPILQRALRYREELVRENPVWESWTDPGVSENTIRRRAEMMLAVDEGLGRIIEALKSIDKLENTLIIFTSDNGYFFGEHALSVERRLPYEESVSSPLIVQYPLAVDQGKKIDGLVLSIDYAATILDAAGLKIPTYVQGKSLMPLLTGAARQVRDAAYMEFYSHENPFPWTAKLDYRIIRRGDYKYIRWIRFEEEIGMELYNLRTDPYEQKNLAYEDAYKSILLSLQEKMQNKVVEAFGLADEPPVNWEKSSKSAWRSDPI